MSSSTKPNIFFLGTHGQKNWGDELLLETFLHNIRTTADTFFVNSSTPQETTEQFSRYSIETFHTTYNKFKLITSILRSKYIVFGGGSIVKELNSTYGGDTYSTMQKLLMIVRIGKVFGKKIIFSNIGIGPINTDKGLDLAKQVLEKADFISLRDIESMNYAQKINLSTPYQQVPDAVFSLSREYFGLPDNSKEKSTISATKKIKRLVINLCRNIDKADNWDYFYVRLLADLRQLATDNHEIELIGLPMQSDTPTNDDNALLETLRQDLKETHPLLHFEIIKPSSTQEIAQVLNSGDLILAERLHLLILSTIIGKPFVALEYNIKVSGLLQDLGLEQVGVKICDEFPTSDIRAKLDLITSDYSSFTTLLQTQYQIYHQKDLEYFTKLRSIIN